MTPHDVVVFACRDNFPDKWAEADDFADVVLDNLRAHGFKIYVDTRIDPPGYPD